MTPDFIYRRWVTKSGRGCSWGLWTHWALGDVAGKVRILSLSRKAFEMLAKQGVKQLPDCQRHKGMGVKPPTAVVEG